MLSFGEKSPRPPCPLKLSLVFLGRFASILTWAEINECTKVVRARAPFFTALRALTTFLDANNLRVHSLLRRDEKVKDEKLQPLMDTHRGTNSATPESPL